MSMSLSNANGTTTLVLNAHIKPHLMGATAQPLRPPIYNNCKEARHESRISTRNCVRSRQAPQDVVWTVPRLAERSFHRRFIRKTKDQEDRPEIRIHEVRGRGTTPRNDCRGQCNRAISAHGCRDQRSYSGVVCHQSPSSNDELPRNDQEVH